MPAPTLGWSDRRKENAMRVVEEPKAAEVIEPSDLVKAEEINAVELFTGGGVNELIAKIQQAVRKHVPDISTDAGRKAVASLSRNVSSAKVLVDNLGKEQVAEWKAKAAKVDAGRKVWRDAMDALRDEAREPLTKWEAEQERLAEEARLAALKAQAEEEAYAEYALRERERIVREKEAELARIEEENRRKAEAERAERERVEREERIRREAEEKARRQAQEEAERKERERLAAEEAERKRLERLAANAKHRERIHREARESLVMLDFTPEQAAYLVEKIAAGEVNNVRMVY